MSAPLAGAVKLYDNRIPSCPMSVWVKTSRMKYPILKVNPRSPNLRDTVWGFVSRLRMTTPHSCQRVRGRSQTSTVVPNCVQIKQFTYLFNPLHPQRDKFNKRTTGILNLVGKPAQPTKHSQK